MGKEEIHLLAPSTTPPPPPLSELLEGVCSVVTVAGKGVFVCVVVRKENRAATGGVVRVRGGLGGGFRTLSLSA